MTEDELQCLSAEEIVKAYLVLAGLYVSKTRYAEKLETVQEALWERIESQTPHNVLQSELDHIKERLAALEQQQNP